MIKILKPLLIILNYEKKISDVYDKIDKIDIEKKYLKAFKSSFAYFYGNGTITLLNADERYSEENSSVREINYCIRHWELSRSSTFYAHFFPDYKK